MISCNHKHAVSKKKITCQVTWTIEITWCYLSSRNVVIILMIRVLLSFCFDMVVLLFCASCNLNIWKVIRCRISTIIG